MRKFNICILFFIASMYTLYSQTQLPILNTEQIKQDYEYLLKTIIDVNPNLQIQKEVMGIDVVGDIKTLEKELPNATTATELYDFVNKVLSQCRDPHCGISYLPEFSPFYKEEYNEINSEYVKNRIDKTLSMEYSFIGNIYKINDSYYSFCPYDFFDLESGESVYLLESGFEIMGVNNIPISEILKENIFPFQELSTKYTLPFLRDSDTLFVRSNGKSLKIPVGSFGISINSNSLKRDRVVKFFPEHKILFIQLPQMGIQYLDYYEKEIVSYRDEIIDKIIIDIRGNTGGNDLVWGKILSLLVNDTIYSKNKMVYNNSTTVRDYITSLYGLGEINSKPIITIPFLNNNEYLVELDFQDTNV